MSVTTKPPVYLVVPVTPDSRSYYLKRDDGRRTEHGNKARAAKKALDEALVWLQPNSGRYLKIEICETP